MPDSPLSASPAEDAGPTPTPPTVRCMRTEDRGDRTYQCDSYSGHPGERSFNIDLTYWTGIRPDRATPSSSPATGAPRSYSQVPLIDQLEASAASPPVGGAPPCPDDPPCDQCLLDAMEVQEHEGKTENVQKQGLVPSRDATGICSCAAWRENIGKVNAPLLFAAVRTAHHPGYAGEVFHYCPWCGTGLTSSAL